ncbi:MAG: hypothetical protein K0S68_556 [Candidatus Saccharibacteria bacterium]|nr:hypothetical protein [Candidatus Saccharibacteria bacterium]
MHPLELNLHEGNARGFRATISSIASAPLLMLLTSMLKYSPRQDGRYLDTMSARVRSTSRSRSSSATEARILVPSYIVFIFQTNASFRLESIQTIPGGLPNEPDIDAIDLLPRRSEGRLSVWWRPLI